MKKIKLLLICALTSLTFTSCDVDTVLDSLQVGLNMYEQYEEIRNKHRGQSLEVMELKNVKFKSSRGNTSNFLNNIKNVNYISYPGVDSKFRNSVISELKNSLNSDSLKKQVCNMNECVYSFKNKALIITKQNGNNLDAMTVKGNFDQDLIQEAIKSGDIFKIKNFIK